MITRRTILKGMGIAPFLPYIGMDSAMAAPLSEYAKLFKACRDARMNIFFDIGVDNPIDYEDIARKLIAGHQVEKFNSVKHVNKMIDALRTLDLPYKIVQTNTLDNWDFVLPIVSYPYRSNIFDDVDVVILEDFAKAMPIVQTLILRHITTCRYEPTNKGPMFIITGKRPDKIYQRFHLHSPAANFVAFEV